MAEIVLCCGQVSSGKSTFARRLAAERGHFPFSADEWMRHFYGEPPERDPLIRSDRVGLVAPGERSAER